MPDLLTNAEYLGRGVPIAPRTGIKMEKELVIPEGAPTRQLLERLRVAQVVGHLLLVTPDMAHQWLLANRTNRRLRENHINNMAFDIKSGEWKYTHQGIAFDKHGELIDGQHRLLAIIKAATPALVMVFIELPDDIRKNIDLGRPRDLGDLTGSSRNYLEPCRFLAGLAITEDRAVRRQEVEALMEVLADDIDALQKSSGTRTKSLAGAAVRSIWALRHHRASKKGKTILVEQWPALILESESDKRDRTTAKAASRLASIKGGGGTAAKDRAMVAWIAFDPADREHGNILLKSDRPLREIRDAIDELLEKAG